MSSGPRFAWIGAVIAAATAACSTTFPIFTIDVPGPPPPPSTDGVVYVQDFCPAAGCPKVLVRVADDRLVLGEEILFETGNAFIDHASDALVGEVVTALRANPDIDFLEVAGHADKRGDTGLNRSLTQRRAEAVVARLVAGGIDARRLRAAGYGSYCPLDPADTEVAYALNRRVEMRVLRRSGRDLPVKWGGCEQAQSVGHLRPEPIPASAPRSQPRPQPRPRTRPRRGGA
jgi:OmpA-OmpF porin, OOP family